MDGRDGEMERSKQTMLGGGGSTLRVYGCLGFIGREEVEKWYMGVRHSRRMVNVGSIMSGR